MREHDKQFLEFYEEYRVTDQKRFYEARQEEFEKAHEQVILLNTILMILAAVAAGLGVADAGGLRLFWGILTALFPLLATALSAYEKLFRFEDTSDVYQSVALALQRIHAKLPDMNAEENDRVHHDHLQAYVSEVEGEFKRERQQLFKPHKRPN